MAEPLERETRVTNGTGVVVFRMIPEVADALADVLDREFVRTGDAGWKENAPQLRDAAESARRLEEQEKHGRRRR
jgi:hypothetical protein